MVFFKYKTHNVSILQEQLPDLDELRIGISSKEDETIDGDNDIIDEWGGGDVSDSEGGWRP